MCNSQNICAPGFSLIEVLIALFILSIGLLSIAALEITSLKRNHEALLQSLAAIQINSLFDRLQVGDSAKESAIWQQNNNKLLPQAESTYNNSNKITICWYSRYQQQKTCLTNHE